MSTTRELPHSDEMEECLLSCVLLDGGSTMANCVNLGIHARMFYVRANGIIFDRLVSMLSESKAIELTVLAHELKQAQELGTIGGIPYLTGISRQVPTTVEFSYYAEQVAALYLYREAIRQCGLLIESCYNSGGRAPSETLSGPVSRLLSLSTGAEAAKEPRWDEIVTEADSVLDNIIEQHGMPSHLIIEFPWACMNEEFYPMQRGQLVVVAARTSVGKSSLARPIATHAARMGHKVYFVTLEVNPVQVVLQMAASISGVNVKSVAAAHSADQAHLKKELASLRSLGITISRRDRTISRIIAKVRALHARGLIDLLVLDHGLLVDDVANASKDERATVIGSLTKALKKLATELDIVCMLLWQLNRESVRDGNREPSLTDLKDSGSLEEDADKVILIHRPSEDGYTRQAQNEHETKDDRPSFFQNIIQAKGRDDGTSILSFYFKRETATFRPASRSADER